MKLFKRTLACVLSLSLAAASVPSMAALAEDAPAEYTSETSAVITVNGKKATVINDGYAIQPLADYDLINTQNSKRILNKVSSSYTAEFENGIDYQDGYFTTNGASGRGTRMIYLPNNLFTDQNNGDMDWTLSYRFKPLTDFNRNEYTTIMSAEAGQHYVLRAYNKEEDGTPACFRLCFNNGAGASDDASCQAPYGADGVEFKAGSWYTITMAQTGDIMNVYVDGKKVMTANAPFNLAGSGANAKYSLGGSCNSVGDAGAHAEWSSVRFYADCLNDDQVKTVVAEQSENVNAVAYTTENLNGAVIEAEGATVAGDKVTAANGAVYTVKAAKPATDTIEFEKRNDWSAGALKTETNAGKPGATGENVGGTYSGAWLCYKGIDFGKGADSVSALYCNNSGRCRLDAWLEFRTDSKDGPVAAKLYVPATGDNWDNYKTAAVRTVNTITGIHDLYVKLGDDGANTGNPYIANLDSFKFTSDYLFYDDFSDLKRSQAVWNLNGDTELTEGKISVKPTSNAKVSAGSAAWRDYVCEATVMISEDNTNYAGLIIRTTSESGGPDAYRGYYFGVRGNSYQIGKANGSWKELAVGDLDLAVNEEHTVTVKCFGEKMRMYVDGEFAVQIMDNEHRFGGVGLRTFNKAMDATKFVVRELTDEEINNEFYSGTAKLKSVSALNAETQFDEEAGTITVSNMLKNSDKRFTAVAEENGTVTVSEDGSTLTVTSENGKNTKDYKITYTGTYVDSLTLAADAGNGHSDGGVLGTYDAKTKEFTAGEGGNAWLFDTNEINTKAELIHQMNFMNLDPNRVYLLEAKMAFDFSEVAANADENALVIGNSPCVYNVVDGRDSETGWDNSGSWSAGIYNYYVNGGLYTYGQLKAMQAEADKNDGYVNVATVVSPEAFKYDPTDMASLKIQARIEGLSNLENLNKQFDPDNIRTFGAPDGIKAVFAGYELSLLANTAALDSVKVNGAAAAIDEAAKTVKIELPAGSDAGKAVIEAVAKDNAKAEISADRKTVTVISEDGTATATYAITITVAKTPDNGNNNNGGNNNKPSDNPPANGTAVVNGKTVLYKDGKQVTGSQTVVVAGKTYLVKSGAVQKAVKGYKVITLGKKSYIVDAKGYVQLAKKGKLVKVSKSKWYVVDKKGVVVKAKKGNAIASAGKYKYVVSKKGLVQKAKKKYALLKAGKNKYIVNKKGVVQIKKKKIRIKKTVYKTDKKGIAKKR